VNPRRASKALISLGVILGTFASTQAALAKPYKGGELYSADAIHYGRMEMRMRMARGSGILSTFFTYKNGSEAADAFWEEIDVEVLGKDDATSWQSNIITGQGTRTTSEEVHGAAVSFADDYHTFALEWTPEYVAWEVDGIVVRETRSAQVQDLTNSQSLRFNIWAANIASWVGEFDAAALPQYQFINWISYSRYENGSFVHEWIDDFDSFDAARWQRADWTFDENLADFDPANVVIQDGTLILALTHEGQVGFNGTVPVDSGAASGAGGSSGGDSSGGAGTVGGGGNGSGGEATSAGGVESGGSFPMAGGAFSVGGDLGMASGGAPDSALGTGGGPVAGGATQAGGAPSDVEGTGAGSGDGLQESAASCGLSPSGRGSFRASFGAVWLALIGLIFWGRRRQARTP
jgi:endo-1,3-1,4-beta-glycanase ExoK